MMMLFTSCGDDDDEIQDLKDEGVEFEVSYDIMVPHSMLEIADAYVSYEELGETHVEKLTSDHFTKSFSYRWEKEELNNNYMGFNQLSLYYVLKIPASELTDGYQMFKDDNSYFEANYRLYSHGYWGAEHTATTHIIDSHKYTVDEMLNFFDNQPTLPAQKLNFDLTPDSDIMLHVTAYSNNGIQ